MPGGERSPCGACKFLRRKCIEGCVFAPYFSTVEFGAAHFASIHKIFGASNFSKLLQKIPLERERYDAVVSISYEAEARLQDPVYGCVSHIFALQRQVAYLQAELNFVRARLGNSSVRTSLTPHYVNGNLSEILTTSSIQSPSEPLTCYQCVYESNSKRSCFLMEDNCSSFEASPAHGGDLHDLAFALLKRSRG